MLGVTLLAGQPELTLSLMPYMLAKLHRVASSVAGLKLIQQNTRAQRGRLLATLPVGVATQASGNA